MKKLRSLWVLAAAALTALAGDAMAGDAIRLLIEPPPGTTSVEAGQSIDVQVVGEDSAGRRVGFGNYVLETSASAGEFTLVEAPFRYRYTAPAAAPASGSVQLAAAFRRRPDVAGLLTLAVVPAARRTYDRLVLRGPSSVEFGGTATLEVLAARPDGGTTSIRDQRVVATLDGPGTLETAGPGALRYTAPARSDSWTPLRRTARIVASLERDPGVTGELTIALSRDGAVVPPLPPAGAREPTRLVLDLPQGVATLEPGQTLDVQVAALDAAGERVPLGDRRVEASATEGDVSPPDAAARFRYTAPAALDAARGAGVSVQIRAWLKQRPDVQGAATATLVARRPFDRLVVRGPSSVEAGESTEVEVLGVRADGASARVRDLRVAVVLDGPGTLESLSPGLYRYTAPRDDSRGNRRAVRIAASLERWPTVTGELSIEGGRRGGSGDGVSRLAFEPPPGTTSVEAGRTIELRLAAFDAAGARVALGDRRVETSASVGELALVEAPDRFRYTAPAVVDGAPSAELRAWIPRGRDVGTTATLQLQLTPRRAYERLVVRGPTSVEIGRTVDLDVLLVRPDGAAAVLRDQRIAATLEGPGTLEAVSPGVYRYSASTSIDLRGGLRVARVVVALESRPNVQGELSIVLMPDARSPTPYGRLELRGPAVVQLGTSADLATYFTRRDGAMSPVDQRVVVVLTGPGLVVSTGPGTFRYSAPPSADLRSDGRTARLAASLERDPSVSGELVIQLSQDPASDADAPGVLWPGGDVRLVLWRAKDARDDSWSARTLPLPAPGRPLVSEGGFVRLRIQPERDDVRKIELEWYVGRTGAVVHVDDSDPAGRLRLVRAANGRTHAIVETDVPDDKPLYLDLLLTTAKGEILREEFVVERSRGSRR